MTTRRHVVRTCRDLWLRHDGVLINRVTSEEIHPGELILILGKPSWWSRRFRDTGWRMAFEEIERLSGTMAP